MTYCSLHLQEDLGAVGVVVPLAEEAEVGLAEAA